MKKIFQPKYIPFVTLGIGAAGAILRLWLFSTGIDQKGLLQTEHPANAACYILAAVVMAVIFLCLRSVTEKKPYRGLFPPSVLSAVGCWIAAAGVGFTALAELQQANNAMSWLCIILGAAATVSLAFAGAHRLKGSRPNPVFHALVTAYLMLHLVCQYRLWNSETQLSILFFRLMASVFLMLSTYHLATLDAGSGSTKQYLFFRYGALFFCCLSVGDGLSVFYISMTLWTALSGCDFSVFDSRPIMVLPERVHRCLGMLEDAGYDAYTVGGCVRDSLLGFAPQDYDLCTNATPAQIAKVFSQYQLVRSGEKHGTIGVVMEGTVYEITTFRTEGGYSDSRHPDWVKFVKDIRSDLARRDFTVNAMAYSPARGYVDPFGGQADLDEQVLRTVGDPRERFTEDPLRILRGVRFAVRYQLTPHPETEAAMFALKDSMDTLARERVFSELSKLLERIGAEDLIRYAPIITQVIPELAATVNFQQHSPHHAYDVYTHTAHVVAALPRSLPLRLAALLHDIAKPATFTLDEEGNGHFYGHAQESARMADQILLRLKAPNALRQQVVFLVEQHMHMPEPDKKLLRRAISKYGAENMAMLLQLQRADFSGTAGDGQAQLFDRMEALMEELTAQSACLRIQDLAVDGNDLLALGFAAGPQLGQVLSALLEMVLDERIPNEKEPLLSAAATLKK